MMVLLKLSVFLLMLIVCVVAVRIGVSKEDATTNSTITTTNTTPTTTPIAITATATTTTTTNNAISTTSAAETTNLNDLTTLLDEELSSIKTTKFPDFAVPTLSTKSTATTTKKKTKTYIKTTTSTTPIPSTSSSTKSPIPTTTTTTENVLMNETHPLQAKVKTLNFYCSCDLRSNVCDLNCCCDTDCTAAALNVFDCHALPAHPELRKRLEDFEYQHGLPSCKVNDGWLCVFRTNTVSVQQREQRRQQQALHAHYDTAHNYKWCSDLPEQSLTELEASASSGENIYKYGASLQLLHVATQIQQPFELPAAFGLSPFCHIKTPVRHLRTERRICLLPTLEISAMQQQQQQTELISLTLSTRLLMQPHAPFDDALHDSVEWQIQHCHAGVCMPLPSSNQTVVARTFNAARIVIQLEHNYTHILAATLLLHEQESEAEQWQIYEVQFVLDKSVENSTNNTTIYARSQSYSGPLGYLQGEPVIVAHPQPPNVNTTEPHVPLAFMLDYFEASNTTAESHKLHLFSKRLEICHKTLTKRTAIAYGINIHKTCKMRLDETNDLNASTAADYNYTHICGQLQRAAWSLLFDSRTTLEQLMAQQFFVSQFGRPENRSDAWLPLLVNFGETHASLPPISGAYSAHTQTFVCHNILLSLAYEFQIGTFSLRGHSRQALITQAALRLGARLDLEFELHERLEVPLSVTAMFYDHASNEEQTAAAAPIKCGALQYLLPTILVLIGFISYSTSFYC